MIESSHPSGYSLFVNLDSTSILTLFNVLATSNKKNRNFNVDVLLRFSMCFYFDISTSIRHRIIDVEFARWVFIVYV